jgi:hypothetical protein
MDSNGTFDSSLLLTPNKGLPVKKLEAISKPKNSGDFLRKHNI